MALNETEVIELSDLPAYMRKDINTVKNAIKSKNNNEIDMLIETDEILPLKEYEKIIIEKALKKYGSYNAAGKALGLTHKTVARRQDNME